MPSRLTEQHRLAQLGLGVLVVRRLQAAFTVLKPSDLDGTFADWLTVVVPIVQASRSASSQLAANYLSVLRAEEIGGRFTPVLAGPASARALSTSMLVTGPVSIRSALGRGEPLANAVDVALERSSAAGMRYALNGGRETITATIKADPKARGYQRVTSGNACEFCSMLADRGAVYGEAAADFEAHDRCGCTAEPVYA